MTTPADHPVIPAPRVGILLINLGTPDAPDPKSVRRYLAEFLSDRRVVEIPRLIWQPILHGIILTTRPIKSAHAYQQVWTDEGSPLAVHTRATAHALQGAMPKVTVDWAMRYGNPAISDRLAAMKAAGCERILLAPLYPQYSGATTATANDAAFAALKVMRWQPAIRTLPPYHDDPAYIDALKTSIEADIAALPFIPDVLLVSFHGMPERTLRLGDPYHCQSMKTVRLLGEALSLPIHISFQSRFGRARWLEPETEATLAN
ncbi:ferrochelatase, partial [Sphingobium sp.]|uniref:ferrochelatase n=1 Tax=Sphingobium sp. TaxID=1912891 RepID=UPI002BC0C7CC